ATADVRGIAALGDHPFGAKVTHFFVELWPWAIHVIAESDVGAEGQRVDEAFQDGFTFFECHGSKVVAVEMDQVEDEGGELAGATLAEGVLQGLEAADAVGIEDDSFAIENRLSEWEL